MSEGIKTSPWEIAVMVLAGLSLVLVIANAVLVIRNESLQAALDQRQQSINQGVEFARIRQALLQALGNVAASKNDKELTDLLTQHGISIPAKPAAPVPAPAPQAR